MTGAIYARKSNEQEGVNATSESVERQIAHAKAYAVKKGWTVAEDSIFYDDAVSGAVYTRLAARNKLVDVCEAGAGFQVLVVSEQSRLGRDMIEVAYTVKRITECGVRIVAYLDDSEISVEDDQALLTMLRGYKDQGHRKDTSRRVYDSAIRRVRSGQVAGAKIYGYDNVPVAGQSGKKLHTERRPNPAQAAVVRRIFEVYASGTGSCLIARRLNAEGVPAPRARGWSQTGVRGILRNPIYAGEVVWGKTKTVVKKGRERNVPQPASAWVRVDAPALRLVDDALWVRVQARRAARQETIPRSPRTGTLLGRPTWRDGHSEYLLPGFASCALCGGSVRTLTIMHGSKRRRPARFYVCAEHDNRGAAVCRNATRLTHDLLDGAVLATLTGLLDATVVDAAVDDALRRLRARHASSADRRQTLARELAAVEAKIQRLVDAITRGDDTPAALVEALRVEEGRKRALAADLGGLAAAADVATLDGALLKREVRERAADVRALLGRHVQQARQMLRKILAGPIRMTPVVEGGRPGYRYEGTLTFDRLFVGSTAQTILAGSTGCA